MKFYKVVKLTKVKPKFEDSTVFGSNEPQSLLKEILENDHRYNLQKNKILKAE